MRKNKSKLMAFSLLALCVACLAFGVYALKNATLTVSGTVGFTAHDCMVKVSAYIEGDGLTEAGTTATDGHPSEERALNFRNANSNEITVGGATQGDWNKTDEIKDVIYFTDLTDDGSVAPITIKFKLTNLSVYDVYARIANIDELTEKGVSVVVSDEVVMQESNDSETDEEVLTAVFTLDTTKVTDAGLMEGFELKLDFGKYVAPTGGEEGGEEENGGEEVEEIIQLATPTATLVDGVVTVTGVENAVSYNIVVLTEEGGEAVRLTPDDETLTYDLKTMPISDATYTIAVQAMGDAMAYSNSELYIVGTYQHVSV